MRRRQIGVIGSGSRTGSTDPRRVRLRAPSTGAHHVVRPRLHEALDAGLECPVTLIVAPAGAGKTTLVAGWLASSAVPAAWLSLDEADRDVFGLWSRVLDALHVVEPGCADHTRAELRRSGDWSGKTAERRRSEGILAAVDRILAELAEVRGGRGVLVVDDLHEVDDEPLVVATLTRFLQHLPGWLHVVLLSRRSPQLPLGRMRVRGQLDELGFDELRFSPDEARALMTRLAPALSDARVAAAARRADGWAAGLQLAALAARAERARQSTGPGPDGGEAAGEAALLHDYLMGEVFGAEDEELVEALVDTAIVERVNGSLAGALTGRADAEELLQRAAARGLFVTRPGAEGWFVVHPPVRAVLAAELSRRAERLVTRHARAAQWFEAAGDIPAAIDHLIEAGDARAALHLLAARHGELYDRGLEALVRRTIAAIPAEVAAGDLGARIDYAWCHLLVSRQRFSELVDQLTWSVARSAEPVEPPTGARVRILASISALMNGDWNGGGALAREALDELGDAWWRDPLGRFGWNMVAQGVALDERWDELSDELREIDVMLSRDPHRRLALEGTRALGEALAGRPVDALRVVAGVRRAVDAGHLPILRGELRLAEAVALREIGDRGAALQALEAIVATPSEALHHCRVLAALELTGARLDDGDADAAGRDLDRALDLAAAGAGIGAVGRSGGGWWDVVSRVATRVALARGDAAEAAEWSVHIVDPLWRAVSEAQVQLATGQHAAAMTTLEGAAARCVRHEVVLALLRARAAPGAEERIRQLGAAVELAAANGMLQTVVSEAPDIVERVEHVAWRVPDAWVDRLRRAATGAAPVASAGAGRRPDGVDALTERERDVLRFLPSRLTQQEIASELFVSLNTLKFHLKVIYRKLGVGSRAEAAEVARRMASAGRGASTGPGPSPSASRTPRA